MMQEDEEEGRGRPLETTEDLSTEPQSKHHRRRIFSNASRSQYLENSLAATISQTAQVANQSAGTSYQSPRFFRLVALLILLLLAAILYATMLLVFR